MFDKLPPPCNSKPERDIDILYNKARALIGQKKYTVAMDLIVDETPPWSEELSSRLSDIYYLAANASFLEDLAPTEDKMKDETLFYLKKAIEYVGKESIILTSEFTKDLLKEAVINDNIELIEQLLQKFPKLDSPLDRGTEIEQLFSELSLETKPHPEKPILSFAKSIKVFKLLFIRELLNKQELKNAYDLMEDLKKLSKGDNSYDLIIEGLRILKATTSHSAIDDLSQVKSTKELANFFKTHPKLQKELLSISPDPKSEKFFKQLGWMSPQERLFEAFRGDDKLVKQLITQGVNPNITDEYKETPLHKAAREDIALVKLLLDYGANANPALSNLKTTPLKSAVLADDIEMVKLLLENGADSNIKGANILHAATCNLEILKLLIEHKGNINSVSEYGSNIAHAAAFNIIEGCGKAWEVLKWLKLHNPELLEAHNNEGKTARDILEHQERFYALEYDKALEGFPDNESGGLTDEHPENSNDLLTNLGETD